MWKDNIIDVKYKENWQDLYLGLANSKTYTSKKMGHVAKISVPVMASVLALTATGTYLVWICKLRAKRQNKDNLRKVILVYLSASNELGDEKCKASICRLWKQCSCNIQFF